MNALTVPAPAKVNLSLKVTGRRRDGRHELDAPTVPAGLCDFVCVRSATGGAVTSRLHGPAAHTVRGRTELAARAARTLRRAAQVRCGAAISVRKNIPAGAGLGGGSSDAAAALIACNRLWNLRWPTARLAELGAELGADVPFFVHCRQARMRGAGEVLEPLARPVAGWFVLAVPERGCPTARVFARYAAAQLAAPHSSVKIAGLPCIRNDLLTAAIATVRDVADVLKSLLACTGQAGMSGSGSGCFALLPNRAAALGIVRQLHAERCKVYAVPVLRARPRVIAGEWPRGKATDFGSVIRRFESYLPSPQNAGAAGRALRASSS